MTVLDLIKQDIDIDVIDSVTEELYIAFVGPQRLTEEGEKEFVEVLDMEVTMYHEGLAEIHVEGPDGAWQKRLDQAKRFFWGAAGYVPETLYKLWFEEVVDG